MLVSRPAQGRTSFPARTAAPAGPCGCAAGPAARCLPPPQISPAADNSACSVPGPPWSN